MNILAFDTSTSACSVALSSNDKIYNDHVIQPRGHANLILSMIESLITEAGITLNDINLISFGNGPGSFTGLRITAGVCQGIAYSHDIPIVAISSLRILAQGVFRETQEKYIAILQDARMSEIYWGSYIEDDGVLQLYGKENVSKPDMVQLEQNKKWYSCGEAWLSYRDKLNLGDNVIINTEMNYPNAIDMIVLSNYEYNNGNFIQAEDVNPMYLRNNVASRKQSI